jgi:alanine racemase
MAERLDIRGKRPTWAEIDLQALAFNFQTIRSLLPESVRIIAVVKANAYGHGAVAVSRKLESLGADYLAVAFLEEGLELRSSGIHLPVLLLNGFWPGQEEQVVRNGFTATVWEASMAKALEAAGKKLRMKVRIHFKIDTGMSRLGVTDEQALKVLQNCRDLRWTEVEGIFTHLACSDIPESRKTRAQLRVFNRIQKLLATQGATFSWNHAASSAGILLYPEAWFDGVRPGLLLYGINPQDAHPVPLRPVLTLKTNILQLKRIKKGTSVGYGASYTVQRDSLVAILPVGYADGYNRLLSNRGTVLLRGQRVTIAGRISMDLTVIDVTGVNSPQVGDEVVLIGKQGKEEITAKELADLTQTIPYEVLTGISHRVPRTYL